MQTTGIRAFRVLKTVDPEGALELGVPIDREYIGVSNAELQVSRNADRHRDQQPALVSQHHPWSVHLDTHLLLIGRIESVCATASFAPALIGNR